MIAKVEHEDRDEHGQAWNPVTESYTCLHCQQPQKCRHLGQSYLRPFPCFTGPESPFPVEAPDTLHAKKFETFGLPGN